MHVKENPFRLIVVVLMALSLMVAIIRVYLGL